MGKIPPGWPEKKCSGFYINEAAKQIILLRRKPVKENSVYNVCIMSEWLRSVLVNRLEPFLLGFHRTHIEHLDSLCLLRIQRIAHIL